MAIMCNRFMLCVLLWLPVLVFSQPNVSMGNMLTKIGNSASVAVDVVDLQKRESIISHQSTLLLTPASVAKIITTASAFELLGSDYRFHTSVYAKGDVLNGACSGDLLVVGGGDPTLGSSFFDSQRPELVMNRIVDAIVAKGIQSFDGNLVINTGFFSSFSYPAGRLWDDLGNYFGGCPSSLTYRDNTFFVYLNSPVSRGELCKVDSTDPVLSDVSFNCRVIASGVRDSAYVYGVPGMSQYVIQGSIPAGKNRFRIKGALPDPPRQFAIELLAALAKRNIRLSGDVLISDDALSKSGFVKMCVIDSPSLVEIMKVINTQSHNLMADHLWLTMGMPLSSGSLWDQASVNVKKHWKNKAVSAISDWQLYDGSGLSLLTSVSAQSMTGVLQNMWNRSDFLLYKSTLAVGGQSGTLLNLWKDDQVRGRIYAKSGSMTGVVAYAGYLTASSGREYAFTVIVNHATVSSVDVRKSIEQFVTDLVISL